jgi:hypothetical protein
VLGVIRGGDGGAFPDSPGSLARAALPRTQLTQDLREQALDARESCDGAGIDHGIITTLQRSRGSASLYRRVVAIRANWRPTSRNGEPMLARGSVAQWHILMIVRILRRALPRLRSERRFVSRISTLIQLGGEELLLGALSSAPKTQTAAHRELPECSRASGGRYEHICFAGRNSHGGSRIRVTSTRVTGGIV